MRLSCDLVLVRIGANNKAFALRDADKDICRWFSASYVDSIDFNELGDITITNGDRCLHIDEVNIISKRNTRIKNDKVLND